MNQRLDRVTGCHPILRQPVLMLIEQCEVKLKRTLFVVHGFRTIQEQLQIYQKGRSFDREQAIWVVSDARKVVTNSRPGLSAHNVVQSDGTPASLAVDLIPFDATGNLDWKVSLAFWRDVYALAWEVGLDPLGDTVGSHLEGDLGHFEEPGWRLKLDSLECYQPVPRTPHEAALV